MYAHHSTWNMCPMALILYFLHGKPTRGCYKTLPLGGTPSSMFYDTYDQQTIEKKHSAHGNL